ncbi:class I SAM-dependent methyltransferase [uncultured Sphaerotilus sp.]|uniref:class I SAM-dependent methyltransferase n=1 Tax=uncultured Sphaerotilus sp. TaxID=474984 RepID=UPI0030CA2A60
MNTMHHSAPNAVTLAGDPADDGVWRALLDRASAPYRRAGRFAWHFARGKLGMDPVFRHLLVAGLLPPDARVLDIGCGQGLLASLLLARGAGVVRFTGIELMARDVARARTALAGADTATFVCGDMCAADLPVSDVVVILDVLHYVDVPAQDRVLARVRDALVPGGRLLLRVGDAGARRGFAISQWVDKLVTSVRGHVAPPTHGRPLSAWIAQLQTLGFDVEARPMSQGTPFANVLLVAQRSQGTAA